tara:strand:+ start:92 stop:472 length:381 start_codon:yes stop_codon:yes gene_type:complete
MLSLLHFNLWFIFINTKTMRIRNSPLPGIYKKSPMKDRYSNDADRAANKTHPHPHQNWRSGKVRGGANVIGQTGKGIGKGVAVVAKGVASVGKGIGKALGGLFRGGGGRGGGGCGPIGCIGVDGGL